MAEVLTKVQKIALLLTFHTQIKPISEDVLMLMIAWVVNGVDTHITKNGEPRINWEPYLQFAEHAHREMYGDPEEQSSPEESGNEPADD